MSYRAKLLNYFYQRDRGLVISLLAAVCLVYLPFLGNLLLFDDLRFFSGTVSHYIKSPFDFNLRWFPYASLAWTWEYFSDVPHIHRLFNMLLHVICVLLLFFWLRQITMLVAPAIKASDTKISYSSWGAWLGALFFACHPLAVYAVGYMIQRSTLMATLFTLAMQLVYVQGLVCEQKLGQKLWLALSALFYFFAVFSKEHSLMAPAIVLVTTILLRPHIRADSRALWITWLGYAIIGLVVVLSIKGIFGIAYEIDAADLFEQQGIAASAESLRLLSILTQAGLYFKYLFLWLLPNPAWMSIDMREAFASSLNAWQNWLGGIGFILYGLLAFRLLLRRGKLGLAGLALLYPWLFFMVEFSTVRVQEPFVLYRSYLWLPGMMLLFPLLLDALPNRKSTIVALTVITLSLVPLSWNRLWVFSDPYRLWNDAALLLPDEHTPGAARIYYNRGSAELATKRWNEAIADYRRVISINPKIAQVYNNIGVAYSGLGRYQEAISEFDQAIALRPNYAEAYYGKGMALKRLHSNEEALVYIKKGCELGNNMACIIMAFQKQSK